MERSHLYTCQSSPINLFVADVPSCIINIAQGNIARLRSLLAALVYDDMKGGRDDMVGGRDDMKDG
jgi:hypothetical protein